jgi:hypothetical protein
MRGAIPPLPNSPSWRCAQSTVRTFAFTLPLPWCQSVVKWCIYIVGIKHRELHLRLPLAYIRFRLYYVSVDVYFINKIVASYMASWL